MAGERIPTVQAARMMRAEGLVWRYCLSDPAPGVVWLDHAEALTVLGRYGVTQGDAARMCFAAKHRARAEVEAVAS